MMAAERGLEIDPADPDFLVAKGRLHLVGARVANDETARHTAAKQALEAFTSAEGLNPLLTTTCGPLILEAVKLQERGSG
jgi:hypothetical protein